MAKTATLLLANQLSLEHNSALNNTSEVIMIESKQLFSRRAYHKQKIRLILTAMREFADELNDKGYTVHYTKLEDSSGNFFNDLKNVCVQNNISNLRIMFPHDKAPLRKLKEFTKQQNINLKVCENTLFLTAHDEFARWYSENKNYLIMENFYKWQRKRLQILIDDNENPKRGKWSYDNENRKPLPKNIELPKISFPKQSKHAKDVDALITTHFKDNPGSTEINWLPTSNMQAKKWLNDFVDTRLTNFGDYEDAMRSEEVFLFHSALSPLLNIGLLHPQEVLDAVLESDAEINNIEGIVRQIIGWREFMYGLYHHHYDDWKKQNYFGFNNKLPESWWKLSKNEHEVITTVHERVSKYGYAHHIERLMVYGNYMLLNQYDPQEVYEWFLCMFVDAYEWVMVGNVIGMSQYADGGLDNGGFATKPYISGANYLQKMGTWWKTNKDAKEDKWTELYWEFLENNYDKLKDNHRLAPILSRFK